MKNATCVCALAALGFVTPACTPAPEPALLPVSKSESLKLDRVVVPAIRKKPVYTGQMLHYHENLSVTATGTVSLGGGVANVPPLGLSELCGLHCPLPDGHRGALIGIVKEAAGPDFACVFEIGVRLQGRPKCQGRLYLAVNDDSYRDNAGRFTVEFETSPLVRSSTCRRGCLKAQENATKACKETCESVTDEKLAFACVRNCSQQASVGFATCMNQDCATQPDQPADCGQVCAQAQQVVLDACIEQCPPNTQQDTCQPIRCADTCLTDYHDQVGDCIIQVCHGDRSMQDCAMLTYNEFGDCMAAHFPDACDYLDECLGHMPRTAYYCVTGLFPCDRHPDCQ